MVEEIRSLKLRLELDSNKQTLTREFSTEDPCLPEMPEVILLFLKALEEFTPNSFIEALRKGGYR